MLKVLRALRHAMVATGMGMRVDVHALDVVGSALSGRVPHGLPHTITKYDDAALRQGADDFHIQSGKYKYEITGMWRRGLAAEVAKGQFDFYFIIEDDVLFTVDQLQGLCEDSERLEGLHFDQGEAWRRLNARSVESSQRRPLRIRPSNFRYDVAYDRNNDTYLTDFHPPNLVNSFQNVTVINGVTYMVPSTPYSSHVFLTRSSMEYAVGVYNEMVPGWTVRPWYTWPLTKGRRAITHEY